MWEHYSFISETISLLQSFHKPTEGVVVKEQPVPYCFDQRWNGTLRNRKKTVLVLKDICGKGIEGAYLCKLLRNKRD